MATEHRPRRRSWRAALLATALGLAACAAPPTASPSPTVGGPTTSPSPGESVPASPDATPSIAVPEPGRPYDAAAVLAAMADSRRPGGVPDQLERQAIAAAVAAELWTFDGTAWPAMSAGGSCGPQTCSLEIAGAPDGALGEDLYVFRVDPGSGAVEVVDATLRGLPELLVGELDAWTRERWPADGVPGPLASVRWLPPPDAGQFVLSYRSGGEEGSPAVDAHIDLVDGSVTLVEPG